MFLPEVSKAIFDSIPEKDRIHVSDKVTDLKNVFNTEYTYVIITYKRIDLKKFESRFKSNNRFYIYMPDFFHSLEEDLFQPKFNNFRSEVEDQFKRALSQNTKSLVLTMAMNTRSTDIYQPMRVYQRLFRKFVYDVKHSIDVLVNSSNGIFLFTKSKDYHTNLFENVSSIDFKINREDRSMKLTLEEQLFTVKDTDSGEIDVVRGLPLFQSCPAEVSERNRILSINSSLQNVSIIIDEWAPSIACSVTKDFYLYKHETPEAMIDRTYKSEEIAAAIQNLHQMIKSQSYQTILHPMFRKRIMKHRFDLYKRNVDTYDTQIIPEFNSIVLAGTYDSDFNQLLDTHYELFYHLHTRSAAHVENQEIGYNDFGEDYMTEEQEQSMKQYKKQSRANQLRADNITKEIKIIMHSMVQYDDNITELEPIRYTEISIWNSFNSEKAIMSNINSNSLLSDINQYRSDHNKEAFRRELHNRNIKKKAEIAANEMNNTRKSSDKMLSLREERSKPIKYHDFSQIYDRNARFKLYKDTKNDSSDEKKTGSLDCKLTAIKSYSNKKHDSFDSALDDFDRMIYSGTSKSRVDRDIVDELQAKIELLSKANSTVVSHESLDTSDLSSKVIQVCRSVVIISLFVVLAFVICFDLLVS